MIRALLGLLALCLFAIPAHADDNRPLTVSIAQGTAPETMQVRWKVPPNLSADVLPELLPPPVCGIAEGDRAWSDPLGHWREQSWTCEGGLAGHDIAIEWPRGNPGLATIARIESGAGETQTVLLQPGDDILPVPTPAEAEEQGGFLAFLKLGFEHIWEGLDHLLFVTGLIIVAGSWRRILVTVTGFTLAHSLTLALSALDVVRLPPRAVEVAIALSIVFLAVEIAKGPRDTLTWRRPVAVAASFGLLHGFGFASVLREVGLPDDSLLTALFAFNVGIEIGQVIFAGLVFAGLLLLDRFRPAAAHPQALRNLAGYALGITASVWLFQRMLLA